ncbi:putative F-box domain, leucine-rich repeat domain superfamily, F-box-like domain superfamily [Helianthus annuus]|nr:putative F-box domain, leucine-rich repeat domain superfamily, F-box-like domain superfamily [Helianthus annuus]KAJ0805323.1 putative F-box domain, leucine-rich repeat domain superfamily, F-box-like domain superfamily [Helianthus annuus]
MPSTSKSKSNRRKGKSVPKPKQVWRVKPPTRNWLELPSDLMVNILQRIGLKDILEKAQLVCTAWREICKDPALWRVVHLDNTFRCPFDKTECQQMLKIAVDRSQGQLVDLTLIDVLDHELLQYVAARSSQLRRLEIMYYFVDHGIWSEAFKKFPLLEELSLLRTDISQEDIEVVGKHCPLLKTLKVNQQAMTLQNEIALAIVKSLPKLTHLELIGSSIKNTELQAILDGCCHLESLDLRRCTHLDLNEDLGKRCSQQIKHLKLPNQHLESSIRDLLDDQGAYSDDFDEYDAYSDYYGYDDYADYYGHDGHFDYSDFIIDGSYDIERMMEMMPFNDMFG